MSRPWIGTLRLLVRQDVQKRFAGNAVGIAWAVILPLLQLALFGLVFVHVFKARVPDLDQVSYLAFLAIGMWPWFAFSEGVGRAAGALVENAGLLGKVAVPYWQLICARVLVAFGLHGLGFVLVLLVLALTGEALHWGFLAWLLLPWTVLLVLALAAGTVFALLQVFVRDFEHITPYLLTALMFTAPILYAPSMLGDELRVWLQWNPLAWPITAIRQPLLQGTLPAGSAAGLLTVLLVALAAWALYRRLRDHVEDFL